ncbi:type IV toxin-antitoxin system AbiEi family antitoxin domain-containing protein [Promicromonospora thailandica]|uniref:type IV toxin-antitoxin system AbiEi family antitoxin domain-containing protein n=1 Tax=Promicromonospora thailandica TaxID=765201 RepID=UPI0020A2AB3E|nr:type IV toxin-antitoxin system AbiEi family antitoxin domain-containing protein [Promicromonospora thailandica]
MRYPRDIPDEVWELASRQEGLVSIAQCTQAGIGSQVVHRLVRAHTWTRVTRGVYDTCAVPVQERLREGRHDHVRRRAAWIGLLAYADGVATGGCALALLGVGGLPVQLRPEVSRPGYMDAGVRPGTVLRRYGTFPVVRRHGRDVAEIVHALGQALLTLPRDNAVAAISDALREEKIRPADLARIRAVIRRRRGVVSARPWLELVSGSDGSPAETFARLSLVDHGVAPDGQQIVFWADGRFLARVDFCWVLPDGRYLVVEIDGREFHAGNEMLADDAARQNRLVGTGRVVLLRFPAPADSTDGDIGRQVAEHLRRLAWRPGERLPAAIHLPASV